MCAVTNPLVNSYKRLVPGYEAPTNVVWSEKNRSPLARVPARRGEGARVELDGRAVQADVPVDVDPGQHSVAPYDRVWRALSHVHRTSDPLPHVCVLYRREVDVSPG